MATAPATLCDRGLDDPAEGSPVPARILTICTANVCRSPAAAALLAAGLPGVDVVSRGVEAREGRGPCQIAGRTLLERGIDPSGHTSQRLTGQDVRAATLVLTATRWHRASVVELWASARVRTYTLAEAARLARWLVVEGAAPSAALAGLRGLSDVSERVLWLAEQLDAQRGVAPRAPTVDADDLPDPHSGARHSTVLGHLVESVADLTGSLLTGSQLTGSQPTGSPPDVSPARQRVR